MKHQRVFQEPFMRDYFSLTEPQERRQAILDFMGKEDLLEAGSMYLIFGPQSSDPEGNIVLVAHYDTVFDPQWEKEVIVEDGRWTSPHGLGADDGAGVLALMHLYHYYKEVEPQNMPFFIFTDKEEKGMQGAWELAENSKILKEAEQYLTEAEKIIESYLDDGNNEDTEWLLNLAKVRKMLADVYKEMGKQEEAELYRKKLRGA